jgi:hypothetical protein
LKISNKRDGKSRSSNAQTNALTPVLEEEEEGERESIFQIALQAYLTRERE